MTPSPTHRATPAARIARLTLLVLAALGALGTVVLSATASSPTLAISQSPLALTTPSRPQVLFAVGNSQSMDGTLSGAIMTGSGSLGPNLSTLANSSSPLNYAVPAGFTPPLQAADANGNAPYTVATGGNNLADNGASRLNVAKGGLQAILQAYMQTTDFALTDYKVSNVGLYTTWVYYMSPAGANFTFTSTQVSGSRYVPNPCLNYTSASATVKNNCSSIANAGLYDPVTMNASTWLQIGASSDDPAINDVLYAGGGLPAITVDYGAPNPATPFPPNYQLGDYNNGNVLISYPHSVPQGITQTSPTNAGYVPFSPQVVYAERGFGYYGSQAANTGSVVVPMTSAGANPTTASVNAALNAFAPSLQPETNVASSSEIKSGAVQSPIAGLLTQAKTYLNTVKAGTSGSGCPPSQYVVLVSDGLPTEDLAGKAWPPLGSAAAQGYGVTASFNADGSLASTNDQAVTDTVAALSALSAAGIKTYIIGLGAGVDPSQNPQAAATLQAMAMAGGTVNYYPASSPTALVNDLNTILISVQQAALATTASSVNSAHLSTGSVEYQATFVSNDTPYQDWTGELIAESLNPATGAPSGTVQWQAQAQLDTKAAGSGWANQRVIATWNPALNNNAGAGVPFEWAGGSTGAGIGAAQQAALQPSDSLGSLRLAYLRGDSSQEKHNGAGGFRNRSHVLGDIVDSQPAYVGAPAGPYTSASYLAFEQARAGRTPMIYAGANDGMLHAFNATSGAEAFAFVPSGVFANLYNLAAPLYNQSHLFFVDGSPQSGDVQFADASWHTLLVGGEGGGGRTVYALDVTDPQSMTSESALAAKVLWEFSEADMGLSYSRPQIVPVAASTGFAVFFGNGYNSASNKAVLYAVNPQNGQLIAKIDLCAAVASTSPNACSASAPEGLSTVSIANGDGLQGQPVTQAYAGDLQGNLWAIDVVDANPANWKVRLLFQARDAAGNPQPITTAPVLTLNPNYPRKAGLQVMFGTGQFLTVADLTNQQTQTIYGVWDKPAGASPYTRANLQAQTLTLVTAGTSTLPQDILTDTSNSINIATQVGWYDDLPVAGQRVMTDPTILNGSFITTLNTPPANPCTASASAMLLELNYKTGGGFANPQLDINGDLTINSTDTYNNTNPVGVGVTTLPGAVPGANPPCNGSASAPTIVGPNASNQLVKNITCANGTQKQVLNPNNSTPVSAWWQLQ